MALVRVDGEICDLDYSVYTKTTNVDDIFWVCSEPEYAPTASHVSQQKDCSLYQNDWDCMSGGKQFGYVALLIAVVAILIFAIWWLAKAFKPVAAKSLQESNSMTSSASTSFDRTIRERIALLERLDRLVDESTETSFVASPDEEIILIASGVHLVESRKSPARFKGSSSGITVRLSKRVSLRSGSFSGESIPNSSSPTVVDSGQFVVTTKRAVFAGLNETREFHYTKLLGLNRQTFDSSNSVLYLSMSGRKSVSGIGTGSTSLDIIQDRLEIALELRSKTKEQMIAELRSQLNQSVGDGDVQ